VHAIKSVLRREICLRVFEGRLTVPEGVQADKVKAEFQKRGGEIAILLAKEVAAKKIPLVEKK
jgi:HSP20 family molecular chaperone IbpA